MIFVRGHIPNLFDDTPYVFWNYFGCEWPYQNVIMLKHKLFWKKYGKHILDVTVYLR